ncbi:MAG: FCD domain-containing protein [Rhodobacteraceae bacterium]|jgi:DNA-binding FadR family transcriptional regulator|nr:FCD domain-containing protein [Paracoccaceae bacterium]
MAQQESRGDLAYRQLVSFIGSLRDGDRLPAEGELADRFHLSRASIREALARLRAEGQVRSRRGSGSYAVHGQQGEMVRLSAIDSVAELVEWHEVRLALESEAAALAAERRSADDLAQLRDAQERLVAELAHGHADQEDVAFHAALAACAHNPKLSDALGRLTAHIFRWSRLSEERGFLTLAERRELIMLEHGGIVDAVAARDADRARQEIRRHLLNGRTRVLSAIRG